MYLTSCHPIGQVYHLSKASVRFYHEKANNTYGVVAAFFAELTATAVGLLFFIPGTAVAYFMMGFPVPAYPYIVFVFWMVSSAESALCRDPNSPSSYVASDLLTITHINHNRLPSLLKVW